MTGTRLTPAQRKALAAIQAAGYAAYMDLTGHYVCAGTRLRYQTVQALRKAGLVRGQAVPPGATAAGFTNHLRVSQHIVVPAEQKA